MEKIQTQIISGDNNIKSAIKTVVSDKIPIKPKTMADRTFLLGCRLKTLLLQTGVSWYNFKRIVEIKKAIKSK